jgi:hypothetical protein
VDFPAPFSPMMAVMAASDVRGCDRLPREYAAAAWFAARTHAHDGADRGLGWRIVREERTLRAELPGYDEYAARVRYRLIPYVW